MRRVNTGCGWQIQLVIALLAVSPAAAQSNTDAKTAWEAFLAAKGGRERLASVRAIAVFERPLDSKPSNSIGTWLCEFPDRYFRWIFDPLESDGQPRAMIVRDGYRVLATKQKIIREPLPPFSRIQLWLNQLILVGECASRRVEPISLNKTRRHRNIYTALTVESGTNSADLLFTPGSPFPAGISVPARHSLRQRDETTIEVYLRDYLAFDGIQLPTRIIRVDESGTWTCRAEYEINPKYQPTFFERAPDPVLGPEAWRK